MNPKEGLGAPGGRKYPCPSFMAAPAALSLPMPRVSAGAGGWALEPASSRCYRQHPSQAPGMFRGGSFNCTSLPGLRPGNWLLEAPRTLRASPSFPHLVAPLPSGIGTCCSCSWSGCTPAHVVPRRARSKGRRPGRWPSGLCEGSSLSMGLVVALGSAWLSSPAHFPDWTELFTILRSSTGLADKGEAAE